jgi:hypothetical protein
MSNITNQSDGGLYFRASAKSELMTKPRGKSPKEKYDEVGSKLVTATATYASTANKETKTAQNLLARIQKMNLEKQTLGIKLNEPHLSATAIKSARRQWVSWKYDRSKEISNKYTKKGKLNEEKGITLVSLMNDAYFKKNEERLYDHVNRMTGEVDLYVGEKLIGCNETLDVKCSWDIITFYDSITAKLKPVYDWQGVDYMHLTGAERHKICFCLTDTPYMQVLDEIKKQTFGDWDGEMPKWAQVMVVKDMVYTEQNFDAYLAGLDIDPKNDGSEVLAVYHSFIPIPDEDKYYEFVVERDEDKIKESCEVSRYFHKYAQDEFETRKFIKSLSSQEIETGGEDE